MHGIFYNFHKVNTSFRQSEKQSQIENLADNYYDYRHAPPSRSKSVRRKGNKKFQKSEPMVPNKHTGYSKTMNTKVSFEHLSMLSDTDLSVLALAMNMSRGRTKDKVWQPNNPVMLITMPRSLTKAAVTSEANMHVHVTPHLQCTSSLLDLNSRPLRTKAITERLNGCICRG